ncbi:MAG: hypothetical protein HYV25_03425, partial [Candidatus Harrisonbacteria bacterium]|nr:hypothetical protein [Candidatus Harrisonbacteria bacterium]
MSANTRGKMFVWGLLIAVTAGLVWFLSSTKAGRAYNAVLLGMPDVSQRELEELRKKAAAYDALTKKLSEEEPPENPCSSVNADIRKGMTLEELDALYKKYGGYQTISEVHEVKPWYNHPRKVWTMNWSTQWDDVTPAFPYILHTEL